MRTFVLAAAIVFSASTSAAQSIHVDFGSGQGEPPPSYGGSSGMPGVWNAVATGTAANLARWDGTPTSVSVTSVFVGGSPNQCTWPDAGTSGPDQALLDDSICNQQGLEIVCTFEGLAPGAYVVDTILIGDIVFSHRVGVAGSTDSDQVVQGSWSGGYALGTNYSRHHVTTTDGRIEITVRALASHGVDQTWLSGIQLEAGDRNFETLCFGDGSLVPCPCNNNGQSGSGCENSSGTGGASLWATGTISPDTIVLGTFAEKPNVLSIFLQGNAVIPAVPYGDGLRCAGGTLRRMYVKSANGLGMASAPGPGDPSITQRAAALGDNLDPGSRRYYQVYYRDSNASFCAPPQGSTFNATHAVKIVW